MHLRSWAAMYRTNGQAVLRQAVHAEVKKSSKGGGPGQWSAWKATEMAKVLHTESCDTHHHAATVTSVYEAAARYWDIYISACSIVRMYSSL